MNTLERITRDFENFKAYTATPNQGCTRLPFSNETRLAAEDIKKLMIDANLEVREDGVGNIFGVRPGKDSTKPAILCGSHYDSVYNGGNYDGIAGVITAIELARLLDENNITLDRDYIAVAFMDEEGTRFGTGYFGSRIILGEVSDDEINTFVDKDGITIASAMESYGLDPSKYTESKWDIDRIGAFLELHIEQGPVLDQNKIELGFVNGIVGMERYMVKVTGRSDHAGTTPMNMRIDPLDIAAKVIGKLSDFAKEFGDDTVATTGYIHVLPGGMNIIASEVEFSLDIRSLDKDIVKAIYKKTTDLLDELTSKVGASWEGKKTMDVEPAIMDEGFINELESSAKERGYTYKVMPSGAGHDALTIGKHKKSVMVFVPSKDGRSHTPEEYTPYEDFVKGIEVMYDLLVNIDLG